VTTPLTDLLAAFVKQRSDPGFGRLDSGSDDSIRQGGRVSLPRHGYGRTFIPATGDNGCDTISLRRKECERETEQSQESTGHAGQA